MATGKPGKSSKSPRVTWRDLDQNTRVRVLANHYYGSPKFLAAQLGVTAKRLQAFLHATAEKEQPIFKLNKTQLENMRRLRRRMRDDIIRAQKKQSRGEYEAPLFKYDGGIIEPNRPSVFLVDSEKLVNSFWVHYQVEHLPKDDQFEVLRQLYDYSIETGQFNEFRFEYVTQADVYRQSFREKWRRTWKDKRLQEQAQESGYIKLSTPSRPILEMSDTGSDDFLDYVESDWQALKARGMVQVTAWCFTWRKDFANYIPPKSTPFIPLAPKNAKRKKLINKRGK